MQKFEAHKLQNTLR